MPNTRGLLSDATDFIHGGLLGLTTDVLGAPVDIATMAMRPFGYSTPQRNIVGSSDWIAGLLGTAPSGSGVESVGRLATGFISPSPSDVALASALLARVYHGTRAPKKMTLYRAADDDTIVGSGSFSSDKDAARAYLDNPGFGGRKLWRTDVEIDPARLLDLTEANDPIAAIMKRTGLPDPGAIGADEWVPRISYELRDSGIEWVRVRESYPADSDTWIFVGENDPELTRVK